MSLGGFLGNLVCHGQKFLVYPSAYVDHPRFVHSPNHYGFQHEDLELLTLDGVTLRCYLLRPGQTRPKRKNSRHSETDYGTPSLGSVIMFHGNGMNYGDCITGAGQIINMGYTVLILSYRGYAHSEGSPSEKGLQRDAQAALDYLLADNHLAHKPIILYGQSLGGAVAIDLASRNPSKISALIVENTFTSLPGVVRGWPIIGVFSFLCFQRWNSASKLPRVPKDLPILMLSGDLDEVVPRRHMHTLWDIATKRGSVAKGSKEQSNGPPAKDVFKSFTYGTHVDTYHQAGYWPTIEAFLKRSKLGGEEIGRILSYQL
ncbi:alpha/beta-hydrolase [Tricholoma matsutake]|nr:alpha/beta-hydrolase [Tricholoma matsutake 945]